MGGAVRQREGPVTLFSGKGQLHRDHLARWNVVPARVEPTSQPARELGTEDDSRVALRAFGLPSLESDVAPMLVNQDRTDPAPQKTSCRADSQTSELAHVLIDRQRVNSLDRHSSLPKKAGAQLTGRAA